MWHSQRGSQGGAIRGSTSYTRSSRKNSFDILPEGYRFFYSTVRSLGKTKGSGRIASRLDVEAHRNIQLTCSHDLGMLNSTERNNVESALPPSWPKTPDGCFAAPNFVPCEPPSSADLSGEVGEHCLRLRSSRVAQQPDRSSSARNLARSARRRTRVAFSLVTFFWRSKRK